LLYPLAQGVPENVANVLDNRPPAVGGVRVAPSERGREERPDYNTDHLGVSTGFDGELADEFVPVHPCH